MKKRLIVVVGCIVLFCIATAIWFGIVYCISLLIKVDFVDTLLFAGLGLLVVTCGRFIITGKY